MTTEQIDMKEWQARRYWAYVCGVAMAHEQIAPMSSHFTRSQRDAIERIVGRYCERYVLDLDKYEIKELTIEPPKTENG